MVIPPFSLRWVEKMESVGSVAISDELRAGLAEGISREHAWELSLRAADAIREAGGSGVIVTGLKFDTVVDEAAGVWRAHHPPGPGGATP